MRGALIDGARGDGRRTTGEASFLCQYFKCKCGESLARIHSPRHVRTRDESLMRLTTQLN